MTRRLRIIITALLVGAAVLMMHVEMTAAQPAMQHMATHVDHRQCADPAHCQGDSSHQRHLMTACSMILVALLGALLVRRLARSLRSRPVLPVGPVRVTGPPTAAPFRPPDLAVLAVMRC